MIALYGSIGALLSLLFEYINYAFPDPLAGYVDPYSGGIRFAMASLIVLVPVSLVLLRLIRKDIAQSPEKSELWVRRWILVLTLFFAGAAVVIDLITLINTFLGGDITMRFILKVAVVLLVALGVFLHFLADLRGYWNANQKKAQMVGFAVGALVAIAIVAGFFIMGSPAQVRLMRFDDQKVTDLQNIQWQIVNYYQAKGATPTALADVVDPISGFTLPVDPQAQEYRYETTGKLAFKLCATFNAESRSDARSTPVVSAISGKDLTAEPWTHSAGEYCFVRTIDPERYPVLKK